MQSKSSSAFESVLNTASGFLISYMVWVLVVVPLWDIPATPSDNLAITCVFTITSLIRSYVIRRVFNLRQGGRK